METCDIKNIKQFDIYDDIKYLASMDYCTSADLPENVLEFDNRHK